jgi:hypothetical protein
LWKYKPIIQEREWALEIQNIKKGMRDENYYDLLVRKEASV